ncbi:GNAT family N-acetyltransferase [Cochlodiniinecator piscidefendens]|uniref:GNAT family N-acetyltransferase n=1 Tax=Cochlodiniinecator piscidefendens TaxID=2715756 RepID=UPI00140E7FDF|nr:GNAT family N-acetyltransferase [Cochlodiniinecator piscidefendens]
MKVVTQRLVLEPFAPKHLKGLHALDRDPDVMRFLGPLKTLQETEASITRVSERWKQLGYAWWALVERKSDAIIGAACVQNTANVPGAPLEIGWRLATAAQGKGYATEAGQAAMDFAFESLDAEYVIAVADQRNIASHKVMQRLGMTYRGIETHYDEYLTTYVRYRHA